MIVTALVSLSLVFAGSATTAVVITDAAPASRAAVVAAPSWPQPHYGPDRTGSQPTETLVGPANVNSLLLARTYSVGTGGMSAPLISGGVLYTDASGYLEAFDAAGVTDCSVAPSTCTPLWKALTSDFDGMTVSNGDVFVTDAEGVQAFSSAGTTDCAGTPKVCSPLWATNTHVGSPTFTPGSGSPVVSNNILYVPGYGDGLALASGGAYVSAFDALGTTDCTGTPKICTPMWTTTGLPISHGNSGSPAIAHGVIYIANETLLAFSAAGTTDCTGTPKVCSALWTSASIAGATYASPAVSSTTVYVTSWNGKLYAFDAAGSVNCTTTSGAKSCTPLWTATTPSSIGGTPAVAGGDVYTVSTNGTLSAFDAAGSKNCSGAATGKVCTSLFVSEAGPTGSATSSSPAVANGVVYFSSTNGGTYAYDAAGSKDCTASGTSRNCTPLWDVVSGYMGGGSPAIVNGVVYINMTATAYLYAYGAPPTAPTGVKAVTASTTTTTGALSVSFTIGANNGSAIVSQTATCVSSNGGVTHTATHAGATAATISVASLTTGKSYSCTVTAKNGRGVSLPSAGSTAVTVGSPAAPTGAKAVSGSTATTTGALSVSFTIGANNGSAITSQTATCVSSNGGVTHTGTHAGATAATISVASLTTGKTYACTVTATNSRGVGLASAATPSVIVGSPAAPTGVVAKRLAAGQLSVTFTAGANNGSTTTSYTARCASSNGGVAGSASGAASPRTVVGLTSGDSYTCTVAATNSRGIGLASSASTAVAA
jgi:hypothetical protein